MYKRTISSRLAAGILALGLTCLISVDQALAQPAGGTGSGSGSATTSGNADDDDHDDRGLYGLIGLVGLAGLLRRKPDHRHSTGTTTATGTR